VSFPAADLGRVLEALLFAAAEPVPLAKLAAVFAAEGISADELQAGLAALEESLRGRALQVAEVGGGFQLRTRPELAAWVARLEVPKPARLSRAAMEALAVIAYRQPITRAEVEEVRGVDSGGVIKALLDRGLLRILGKKDVPGRPLLYGTAKRFLEVFGLRSLADLPTLRQVAELPAAEETGGTT
jgi:segregation and condensation protein B